MVVNSLHSLSSKIKFYGSQIGGSATVPLTYTSSPLLLLLSDIRLFFANITHMPYIVLPLTPTPSGNLDELHCSPKNIWSMFLHLILFVIQAAFLLSIPICFLLPAWAVLVYMTIFLVANTIFCVLLNGTAKHFQSNPKFTSHFPQHKNEQWLFLNGVAVGHHWMQSNLDRLAITFGRPVMGVHNKTSGIIFDCMQCLIQRNFDYATSDVRDCYRQVKTLLYTPTLTKVVFVLHSQGGIEGGMILDWLLQEVPQDLLSKLEVYTFGCAANHFNNPHRHMRSLVTDTKAAQSRTGAAAEIERKRGGNDKAIRYIEHYANTGDFVARWGVLNFTNAKPPLSNPPVSGTIPVAPRFMGRVFENSIPGHQFNQHYLDNMFPLNFTNTRARDDSPFMDLPVEINDDQSFINPCSNSSQTEPREGLEQSYRGAETGRRHEDCVVVDVNSPVSPPMIGWGESRPRLFRVADLSRLWLYRNGRSPPDDGDDPALNRFATL